ncbi:MAG: dephospho-CoA kinase [Planctomycetia bacterium]|nr:dephospho-CoA kinase [Planctomycetia bacterium]
MITIGIIGRIGAGKSTVARRFGERGARVIDADAIAHEVLGEPDAKAEIVRHFGAEVLAPDGRIDRARLARLVFGPARVHHDALAALEAIVHPRVHRRIELELAALQEAERDAGREDIVAVLDVPLLVRAGWDKACDCLVFVECEDHVRRERLSRRGVSADQQAAREAAWESSSGAAGAAAAAGSRKNAFTVDTSGDLSYTQAQVDRILDTVLPR